jgi:NADPH:quinone reductase-like Zn-dependent oxidoreductase
LRRYAGVEAGQCRPVRTACLLEGSTVTELGPASARSRRGDEVFGFGVPARPEAWAAALAARALDGALMDMTSRRYPFDQAAQALADAPHAWGKWVISMRRR